MFDQNTPPVGPLTSTKNLQPGDIVRVIMKLDGGPDEGGLTRVGVAHGGFVHPEGWADTDGGGWDCHAFAFVGRPDKDGWISWGGGECPLPGDMMIQVRFRSLGGDESPIESAGGYRWGHIKGAREADIVAFRIPGLMDAPRQGDPVEPPFGCSSAPLIEASELPERRFEVRGYDLSRTPKDIMGRAFAVIDDAGPGVRVKGIMIHPSTGLLTVEAWPHGSGPGEPAKTYVETEEQCAAYYRRLGQTGPKTIRPDDVQRGDRVRVTITADVGQTFGKNRLSEGMVCRLHETFGADAVTIELLDRPEKPLAVGDLVRWDKAPGKAGEVRAVDTETQEAWVRWANAHNDRDYSTVRLSDLTRV